MIYIPLEWGPDLGEVSRDFLQSRVDPTWRLPTDKELSRAMRKMKPEGFVVDKYYWSGTENHNGGGYTITYTCDGCGGLGSMPSNFFGRTDQKYPRLRLCRPIKLPE